MSRPVITEAEVQSQCLSYLEMRPGVVAWRSNTGAAYLPGRGGKPRLVRFGVKGVSDILGLLYPHGRFLAVEVKRPGKHPTPDQAAFLANVRAAGGLAACVHSLDELIAALDGKGGWS